MCKLVHHATTVPRAEHVAARAAQKGSDRCARAGMVSFKEFLFALVGWVLEEDEDPAPEGGAAAARTEATAAAAAAATALSRQTRGLRPARRV